MPSSVRLPKSQRLRQLSKNSKTTSRGSSTFLTSWYISSAIAPPLNRPRNSSMLSNLVQRVTHLLGIVSS